MKSKVLKSPKVAGRTVRTRPPLKETDLYPPLKDWLTAAGYTVHGEVGGCDLAARRGDELVLIEIKLAINLNLLLQLTRRQEATETVYAAVPAPRTVTRRWRGLTRLLQRLEVGLVLVYMETARPGVEVAFHPVRQERRLKKSAARAFLTEMDGRGRDCNLGGSTRRTIMTAYRRRALVAAAGLERLGPCAPRDLKALGAGDQTGDILRDNHYGWFERIARGQYALTASGREALEQHRDLVAGCLASSK